MALEPTALTNAIEAAFAVEWPKTKTIPLPDAGKEDRRLMFAAVARGLLQYLSDHEGEFLSRVTLKSGAGTIDYEVTAADLNISTG